jgi:tetratricopeptide (TPR) repeat protein
MLTPPIIYRCLPCLALVLVFLSSCNPSTHIQVLQPANFAVPEHINTIVTVNRSIPQEKVGNIIEGALTGEAIYQDRDAATKAIAGLTEALTRTPRFNVKTTGVEFEGGGVSGMPNPINWQEIERLCQTYKADAVASLEVLDSDIRTDWVVHEKKEEKKVANTNTNTANTSRGNSAGTTITNNVVPNKISKENSSTTTKTVTTREYEATIYSNVKMGWRLYDPKNRHIIDEFMVNESQQWSEREKTKDEAMRKLMPPYEAVGKTSYMAGAKYGGRIAPMWATVSRDYYKKGNDQMAKAYRLTQNKKWKEAAAIWQPLTKSPDQKLAGMACYNMAIACEVEGQLKSAQEWAMQAYEKHNNKKARTYAQILKQRIAQQQKVNEQMKGKTK